MENQDDHFDPTAEIGLETVKNRTVKGIVALTGRYFILYIISLVALGFLGVLLTPAQFGIFGLVSAIVNFLVYFSDIGLAASLIQKKEKVTIDDLKTTFTVQQTLVVSLLIILFLSTGWLRHFYQLNGASVYLLWALGISFLLSSLKTVPSVLLERNLRFEILSMASILENIIYNVSLVILAWKGFGITSFTIAVLLRGVLGLVVIYIFQPWIPKLGISWQSLKRLLKFGIPYQINTFIAVLKDDGIILVLGKVMGLPALGVLTWARKWIQIPLRMVSDNVTRVTFPAYSRMQDAKKELERSVTRTIFFSTFIIFPMTVGIAILAPVIIRIIPKYNQWTVAIIPLMILSVTVMSAGVVTQLTNLLNAIGKIKITSIFMVFWTLLTWLLVPYLAKKYGVIGAASGYALVETFSVIVIFIVKKYVNFSLAESCLKPLFGTFVMGAALFVLRSYLPMNLRSLGILVLLGGCVYLASMFALIGQSLIEDVKKVSFNIFRRS